MLGKQARIRLGSIFSLPLLLLFAGSCTPGTNLPTATPASDDVPVSAASPGLPPTEAPTTGATPPAPCTIEAQAGLTAYQRPDPQAELFADVPAGSILSALGTTEAGWIGFDPQTAQAGNVGPFRLRWLPPDGSIVLTGDCQDLVLYPSLPARTCFTMAIGSQAIYAAASTESSMISTLNAGDYAGVISRTPDGWLELALNPADAAELQTGWMPAEFANFNGPCSAFSPPFDAALIEHYAPGISPEIQQIEMADGEQGWAVAGTGSEDDHLLRTRDGGLTWADITPPEFASGDEAARKQIAGAFHADGSAQVAFYSSEAGNAPLVISLWTTGDWGASWLSGGVRKFADQAELAPLLSFTVDGQGWLWIEQFVGMGTHAFTLLASDDGGQNYRAVLDAEDTNDGCHRTQIARLDLQIGWMTAECPFDPENGAAAQVTTDGGESWSFVSLPTPRLPSGWRSDTARCASLGIQVFDQAQAYLLVRCARSADDAQLHFLFQTQDGGQTWSTQPLPASQFLFLNPDQGWAFGRQIFWTADGGGTWSAVKTVSWDGVFDFVDANHGWAIARSEEELAFVRSLDGGHTWTLLEPVISQP
jgi:photosystem II stability/assembly factor-like uncharacterized protein